MQRLAQSDQLQAFEHAGFWQPMDTLREKEFPRRAVASGQARGSAGNGSHPKPTLFWRGKRVLLTGHTGFKGSWLACGWRAWGGGDRPGPGARHTPTCSPWPAWRAICTPAMRCDVRDAGRGRPRAAARPQIVLHLAAQALVRAGYADPLGHRHQRHGHGPCAGCCCGARPMCAPWWW